MGVTQVIVGRMASYNSVPSTVGLFSSNLTLSRLLLKNFACSSAELKGSSCIKVAVLGMEVLSSSCLFFQSRVSTFACFDDTKVAWVPSCWFIMLYFCSISLLYSSRSFYVRAGPYQSNKFSIKSFVSRWNSCENWGELSLLPVSMLMALGLN